MHSLSRIVLSRLLLAALCAPLTMSFLLAQTSVRSVKVLGSKDAVEIEVQASDRIVPQAQVLTGPDRLVIDFPNAVPGSQLRGQSVNRGEVKDLRVGLLRAKPPLTRLVLDLRSAQSYEIFPNGRTVIIKLTGGTPGLSAGVGHSAAEPAKRPGLVVANYTPGPQPVGIVGYAQPALEVTYRNGLLGITANKATLSEVLHAVQQRTGAEISIAAGADQEQVVADLPPGPAPEVLARLLNGSKFNFLILSAVDNPQRLDRVILSTRPEAGFAPLAPMPVQNNSNEDEGDRDSAGMNPQPGNPIPPPASAASQGEGKTPADENAPQQ